MKSIHNLGFQSPPPVSTRISWIPKRRRQRFDSPVSNISEIDSQPGIPVTTTCQHMDQSVGFQREEGRGYVRFDSPVSNISSFYFDMFLLGTHVPLRDRCRDPFADVEL
jgi:hypothetical protein